MKLLILGGTGEGSQLAIKAAKTPGVELITSLAGRTTQPTPINSPIRVGGFGGATGLATYLKDNSIDALIDATHPFAAQISFNAATAAKISGIPHLMLVRPPWEKVEGDRWLEVHTNQEAAHQLPGLAKRIFLTIGRQELATFSHLNDMWFLMRMIDPPGENISLPPGDLLLEKGPFSLEHELELLGRYNIDVIVSKNSGGEATKAKIIAARMLNLPVVMVKRPPTPDCEKVSHVSFALLWLESLMR